MWSHNWLHKLNDKKYIFDAKYAIERYLGLVQSCQFDEINQIITLTISTFLSVLSSFLSAKSRNLPSEQCLLRKFHLTNRTDPRRLKVSSQAKPKETAMIVSKRFSRVFSRFLQSREKKISKIFFLQTRGEDPFDQSGKANFEKCQKYSSSSFF